MFKKVGYRLIIGLCIMLLLLSACAGATKDSSAENEESTEQKTEAVSAEKADENDDISLIEHHKQLNQEPVPVEMERDGTDVYVKMTTQTTYIESEPETPYKVWTFNREAPG